MTDITPSQNIDLSSRDILYILIIEYNYSFSALTDYALWPVTFYFWNYEFYRELLGLLGLVISPSQSRYINRKTQTEKKRGQISMSGVGLEPTIPVCEPAKTFYALECAATVIGTEETKAIKWNMFYEPT
jgi:hypothetical protein